MYGIGEGLSEEERRLRVLRLLQVREQSKAIAKKLRDRVRDEKCRQSSQTLIERLSQIQKEKQELQSLLECRLSCVGEGHRSAVIEERLNDEWRKEFYTIKEHDARKASNRGKTALSSVRSKRNSSSGAGSFKNKRKSQQTSTRKHIPDISNRIDKFYEENEESKNDCANIQNISSNTVTDETHRSSVTRGFPNLSIVSPFPVKENFHMNKTSASEIVESPIEDALENRFTVAEIEKALCDCKPHLDNVVTNVQKLLKNNSCDNCNKTENRKNFNNNNINETDSTFQDISHNCESDKENTLMTDIKKVEFVPITIVSDYLKSCKEGERKSSDQGFSKNQATSVQNDEMNPSNVKNLRFDIPESSNLNSKVLEGCDLDRLSAKNIQRIQKLNKKPTNRFMASTTNQKNISPIHNRRTIKCYDYNNKFCKNTLVDNDDLIKRLTKQKIDAFQSAFEETEHDKTMEKNLEATKAQFENKRKIRGDRAIEKIRIEDDYKKLQEELETIVKKGNLIKRKQNIKMVKKKVRHPEQNISNDWIPFDVDSNNPRLELNINNDNATNVATWEVQSDSTVTSAKELQTVDSESSMQSMILHESRQHKSMINHKRTDKVKPVISDALQDKSKVSSKPVNIQQESNKIENDFPVLTVRNAEIQTSAVIRNTNSLSDCKESNHISSSSSTVTFEGLEIKIEMRKCKKESAQQKNSKTRNQKVQTITPERNSSSEISISTMKKKETVFKTYDTRDVDSSESTAYMSPPEKMSLYLENYFKRNRKPTNILNANRSGEFKNVVSENAASIFNNENSPDTNTVISNKRTIASTFELPSHVERIQINSKLSNESIAIVKASSDDKKQYMEKSKLEDYVKRLLGMSKTEVNQLNVDVSDVTTPSSSVINMSSNSKSIDNFDVDTYIKETYDLLDKLKKAKVPSNKYKYNIKNDKRSKEKKPESHFSVGVDYQEPSTSKNHNDLEKKRIIQSKKQGKNHNKLENLPSSSKNISNDVLSAKNNKPNINIPKISDTDNVEFNISDLEIDKELNLKITSGINDALNSIKSHSVKKNTNISDQLSSSDPQLEKNCTQLKNNKNEEDDQLSDQLSMECAKRIQSLSDKLNQVRQENISISPILGVLEDVILSDQNKQNEVEFTPILLDIPKPSFSNNISELTVGSLDLREPKIDDLLKENPILLNNFPTRNTELLTHFPRDLSTIIEVDTPVTMKNSSVLSKRMDKSAILDQNKSIIDSSLSIKSKNDGEKSNIMIHNDSNPLLGSSIDINMNPFQSFDQFIKNSDNSNEKNSASNEFSSSVNTSSEESIMSISELIASNKSILLKNLQSIRDRSKKMPKVSDISGVIEIDSSGSLTPELQHLIKSFGPESMAIWNKNRVSQAISSSSSSSHTQLEKNNDTLGKLIDVTLTSEGLSTLYDDFNLSDKQLKHLSFLTNTLLDKKLDLLFKTANSSSKADSEASVVEHDAIDPSKNERTENHSPSVETVDAQSKDKTQHCTSTPVHQSKLSSAEKTETQNNTKNNESNRAFFIDSDISSVRNTTASERNVSSDDRLSVPNVSLKFGKLFDSNSTDQSLK